MRKLLSSLSFIKVLACVAIVCVSIFALNSCSKNAKETTEIDESLKETQRSVPLYCEDLENPCSDPACRPYYDCEPEPDPLAMSLANHQTFINLNSYFDQALNMPDPDSFTYYLDTAQLRLQGDPYLSNLTGYSLSSIDGINDGIIANLQNMQSSFPELGNMTSNQLQNVFSEATDIYLANLQQRIPCSDCRKNGRRNMITRTFLSMATGGSFGGFYGAWAGAVLGFWDAAGEALNCLKNCTN